MLLSLYIHCQICDVPDVYQEEDGALDAIKLVAFEGERSQPQHDNTHYHHYHINGRDALNLERRDKTADTDDERDIEDI